MIDQITYGEMCDTVATDWNLGLKKHQQYMRLTKDDVWSFTLIQQFPALYLPILYDAAKNRNLLGLLLTNNTCAKMFYLHGQKKETMEHKEQK